MDTQPKFSFVCPMKWEELRGEGRERFCEKCQRTVHNLSLLSETQRAALLEKAKTERVCVAYFRHLSSAAPQPPRTRPPVRRRTVLAAFAGFGAVAALLTAFSPGTRGESELRYALRNPRYFASTFYERTRDRLDELFEDVRVYFGGAPRPRPSMMIMGDIGPSRYPAIPTRAPAPATPPPPAGTTAPETKTEIH